MRSLLCLLASVVIVCQTPAADWPAWRGPMNSGVTSESDLPTHWTSTDNVRWKVDLPAPGNGTPIVVGQRIFLTQAFEGGLRRALVAYQRTDGKKLWQEEVACPTKETSHPDNPPCSSSPVADATAVFAHFASGGVLACTHDGHRLWHRDLGPVLHKWGNGSSPLIYKNLVIVFQGPGEPTFLTALDKKTGATVWTTKETGINSPIFGSWATPLVVHVGDHDELIVPLPGERIGGEGIFKAYDPATGAELWHCGGLGNEVYAMAVPSATSDIIVGISGHNGPTMAVRPGGRGDVSKSHLLWRHAGKLPQRIGCGVVHQGRLYLPDADGFAECLDAATGKLIWKERLGGKLWGSMLLAGNKIYVSNLEGKTFVLAAASEFQLLATNDTGEPTYAALVPSSGTLLLRTWKHLYCLSAAK
jgi:outer membrane protein assembly factor BamB